MTTVGADSPVLAAARELELRTAYIEPRWYAAWTRANHEKRVAEQLEGRAVEYFLPLYKSTRHWKDRRVQLELPVFSGYVFVRLALCDRIQVLQIPGVAKLVGFGGSPVALPDEEIDALRTSLVRGVRVAPHPYLTVGRRVRILAGPLAGQEGFLLRWKAGWRVVLSVELIQRSIAVEIDAADLEPASV